MSETREMETLSCGPLNPGLIDVWANSYSISDAGLEGSVGECRKMNPPLILFNNLLEYKYGLSPNVSIKA